VEKKAAEIYGLFVKQCQGIRQEFDTMRKSPPLRPNEPQYAGTALWARSLSTVVQSAWLQLTSSRCLEELGRTREAEEASAHFNKLMGTLGDFKTQLYQQWVDTLATLDSAELHRRLEQPLIKKVS